MCSFISGNIFYVAPKEAETTDPSILVVSCDGGKQIVIKSFTISDSSDPAVAYSVNLSKGSPKAQGKFTIFKADLDAGDFVQGDKDIVLTPGESLYLLSSLEGTTSIIYSGEQR